MASAPQLLNDDGNASMATMFMMSHHGFRRDLARFAAALSRADVAERAPALQQEWQSFKATLHGHHHVEDTAMFPSMRAQAPDLAACIAELSADHATIDPLLASGDAAFAQLPSTSAALAVVHQLQTLLDRHLAREEENIVPLIRGAKGFPPPATDAEAEMYAQGFAWSMQGIAPEVLAKVNELLPEPLTARLPAALRAFDERCERVWGTVPAGAARTPIPNPLGL
jgi:Hemerythrin HHE cation binding domain